MDELCEIVSEQLAELRVKLVDKGKKFLIKYGLISDPKDKSDAEKKAMAKREPRRPSNVLGRKPKEIEEDERPPLTQEQLEELAAFKAEVQRPPTPPPPEPKIANQRF